MNLDIYLDKQVEDKRHVFLGELIAFTLVVIGNRKFLHVT